MEFENSEFEHLESENFEIWKFGIWKFVIWNIGIWNLKFEQSETSEFENLVKYEGGGIYIDLKTTVAQLNE